MCLKICELAISSVELGQVLLFAAFDLGLHSLLRSVCLNTSRLNMVQRIFVDQYKQQYSCFLGISRKFVHSFNCKSNIFLLPHALFLLN